MREELFVIKNRLGLHAKPAALFVQTASRFKSKVTVVKEGLEVNGKSIMGLMLLEAGQGTRLKVVASGVDEAEALEALGQLIAEGFSEP